MKKLIVSKKYDQKKLYKFLKANCSALSEHLFYKTLRKKDIKVNGKRVSKNVIVYENDEVLLYLPDELLQNTIHFDIVYEDTNILLIDKPPFIEVTGNQSLTEVIHKQYTNCEFLPMPCHRLDRNTSGLLLFAKNEAALAILLDKFKQHEIEKHYLAWVYGIPQITSKKMEAYLFKDSHKAMVYISDVPKKGYSKIISSYLLLKKYSNYTSLLDVEIETGRTHQIRAHLAHIGFPIIGDGKYGKNDINKKMKANHQKLKSYLIKFNFKNDAGILNYLNGKEFKLDYDLSNPFK